MTNSPVEDEFDKVFRQKLNSLQPPNELKERILGQLPSRTQTLTYEEEEDLDGTAASQANFEVPQSKSLFARGIAWIGAKPALVILAIIGIALAAAAAIFFY